MQEEQQQPTSFRFNAFQQWEISFVYAFSCIFNAQQQEISPSFYKLPDFTPQVILDLDQRYGCYVQPILYTGIRRRDSKRRERSCT